MKRLFTFGCSHTNHGYPTWANILAEEFDKHFNFGLEGSGPFYIFNQINEHYKKESEEMKKAQQGKGGRTVINTDGTVNKPAFAESAKKPTYTARASKK